MEHNYGTQDVILAGSDSHTLSKRQYGRCAYYGYSIEGLLESINSHTRNTDCFGILVGSKKNMFSIQVHEIDGLERTIEAPAIICLKEDVIERYEPFSSKEEFIQNYLDHVPFNDGLMSELCGEYLLRPSEEGSDLMAVLAIKDSGLSFIDDMDVSWKEILDRYCFLDGSTCGKKVKYGKSKQVKVYEVRLYCDECGEEMKEVEPGVALCTFPATYAYYCVNSECSSKGKKVYSTHLYPYNRYEEK